MKPLFVICILYTFFNFSSCKNASAPTVAQPENTEAQEQTFDLPDIESAGELIAATVSGPESYYLYHGKEMGLQYALAELLANSLGMRLRIEVAHDSTELVQMLNTAKADLIAYPVSRDFLHKQNLKPCGVTIGSSMSWAVRPTSPILLEAVNDWYNPELIAKARNMQDALKTTPFVQRKVHAPYMSKAKGRISPYDNLFVKYGRSAGFDWRMLAALCYQESAFDPEATSWVGAKGLMQIMPKTAMEMGVNPSALTNPETNISTSVRYLRKVEQGFNDIANPHERIKFTLAAYNGGTHHIRDAMRLAQKNRLDPHQWNNVAPFVLHLSEPRYYRDPVVKYGYMIGSETFHYVQNIINRWNEYSGTIATPQLSSGDMHFTPEPSSKKNRFVKPQQILTPEDSIFSLQP